MPITKTYEIFIDASVDADPAYIKENNVRVIPMEYTIDDASFHMGMPLTAAEMKGFYDKMRAGSRTGTSQITPFVYEQCFREAAERGSDVLYLSLSSGLSSTYSSSCTAAQSVMDDDPERRIECVDTLGGTGGMWLLLMLAVRGRQAGKSLTENAEYLRAHALDVCYWFMVEDLEYLRRGGRISAAAAFAGNVLSLKPVLKITDEGTLVNISKQRGVQRALRFMLDAYRDAHDDTVSNDVSIVYADCEDRAMKMADQVRAINPDAQVHMCSIGPVIGAHVGPGMIALIHFGARNLH